MKTKSKKLALLLALMMILTAAFSGCSNDPAETGDNGNGGEPGGDALPTIGIVQVVEHTSLNMIRDSIVAQLERDGYIHGETVNIDIQSGQGDPNIIKTICQQFTARDYDIIIAIATITAQVALGETEEIPIIFSAVTDPITAELVISVEQPGGNVTGTSDYVSAEKIMELAKEITPGFETIGALYSTRETNSISVIQDLQAYADANGLKVVTAAVSQPSEIAQAAASLVGKVDIVFSPIDNDVADSMPMATQIFDEAQLPFYVSADSMVMDGGLATRGINYETLGEETAKMAKRILEGEDAGSIPVKIFEETQIYVNTDVAERIGIKIPAAVLEEAIVFTDENAGNN